jgi:hypothetical protein
MIMLRQAIFKGMFLTWLLFFALPVAGAQSVTGDGGWTLFGAPLQQQIRALAFFTVTEPADAPRNPDNCILNFPRYSGTLQFRPDLELDVNPLTLVLQPRAQLQWERWTQGSKEDEERFSDEAYVHQWLARLSLSDAVYVSYGRENIQWGPAWLYSPSNPFYLDNGKANPKSEVACMDFARAVWVPSLALSVSLIENQDAGRAEFNNLEFVRRYGLKTD